MGPDAGARSWWVRLAARAPSTQTFWVTVSLGLLALSMSLVTDSFATGDNLYKLGRDLSFVGIMALGQTVVILTAGIDLSVGSVMGLSAVVAALVLEAGGMLGVGAAAGIGTALACGAVNGLLVARVRLSPFVVTLAMLAVARSLSLVISRNRMVHDLGPDEPLLLALGGGETLGLANPVWCLLLLAGALGAALGFSRWGRYLYAVGGNEEAARRNGIAVERVKLTAYLASSLGAGIAAVLMLGWLGAVTSALGQGAELRVIAASVIGGAHLMGGEGGALGAVVGAALIEVIRNGLLLAGVDPYWQGSFVGGAIVLAVVLERVRGLRGAGRA